MVLSCKFFYGVFDVGLCQWHTVFFVAETI